MMIRIGTRESALAMAQANIVANLIKKQYPDIEIRIIGHTTKGDQILDKKLDLVGGKGLFVKELEIAMLNNEIDFAVHSAKDMPSEFPKGLGIAGAIKRDDFHDVLISKYKNIRELPQNAIVGTSSPRREVHIKAIRDNIQIKLLRGNILTRLKRYDDGEYDAIILAKAGLDRLNVVRDDVNVIDTEDMIPAVCQGIIAVEGRIDDEKNEIIRKISCDETYRTMICERGFMQQVGGGCSAPIAALATVSDEEMKVVGMIEQNGKIKKDMLIGDVSEFKDLGRKLAIKIKNAL